ncbi:hypothetical protein PR202_gb01691 [Eleusine coracana subsp. coracana]|uniref:Uncharacterized protein n=1 Tax=Eleusine coracana subsp. coracana TaxID=191504 RepID=A0AAV5DXB1_ELECO|nr:hypothetical protein PR202_gb01691 [Eleusine coracana subsp. coracana]
MQMEWDLLEGGGGGGHHHHHVMSGGGVGDAMVRGGSRPPPPQSPAAAARGEALPRGAEAAVGPVRGGDPGPVAEVAGVAGHLRHARGGRARLRPRRPRAARVQGAHQLRPQRAGPGSGPATAASHHHHHHPVVQQAFSGLDISQPSPWHFVYFPSSRMHLHQAAAMEAPEPDDFDEDVDASTVPSTALELRTGPRSLPFDLNEPPSLLFGS